MFFAIGGVSDAMVAETPLPYWKFVKKLFAERVGRAAFDELNCAFQSDGFARRQ